MRPTSAEALEGLGGTLLKAQQPEAAIQIYERFVKAKPAASAAWRGLFMAQIGAGSASQALMTERRIPSAVHAQLMKDLDFLRSLASAYSSAGRDADAQRVLRAALDLPFPSGARGLQMETQLQYASLLQQANHLIRLPANTAAWQGLVRVQHALKQDPQALQTLSGMPPSSYGAAMRDPGFQAMVASIYQGQNRLDAAQQILEKSVSAQVSAGQKPSTAVLLQLAGIYLTRNNPQRAFPIYRQVLSENADRPDAWKGLLTVLHSSGRDQEALAQVQQIPQPVRVQLESDVEYLQIVGAVYNSLGQPRERRTTSAPRWLRCRRAILERSSQMNSASPCPSFGCRSPSSRRISPHCLGPPVRMVWMQAPRALLPLGHICRTTATSPARRRCR
jgi:tetratricopeptide (TPR) repeat protein